MEGDKEVVAHMEALALQDGVVLLQKYWTKKGM